MAHNYGLDRRTIEYTPWSGEPIRVEKTFKKVMLTNVEDCRDRITVSHVEKRLMGIGWFEWAELLAHWLVEAIVDSINKGEKEADISKLFTCDLLKENRLGTFTESQERVIDFIMGRLFECIHEDDEVMRVRIIEKSICDA